MELHPDNLLVMGITLVLVYLALRRQKKNPGRRHDD